MWKHSIVALVLRPWSHSKLSLNALLLWEKWIIDEKPSDYNDTPPLGIEPRCLLSHSRAMGCSRHSTSISNR